MELASQGHSPTVIVPESGLRTQWELDAEGGVTILRVRAARTKDVSNTRRALAEFLLPYFLTRGVRRSPIAAARWDGIVWYSPSIFLAPFVNRLKHASECKSYLILRDLFPDWAADTGVMRRGLAYWLLKLVQRYQFSVADIIGVQTAGNLPHLRPWANRPKKRIEVLHNWLGEPFLLSAPNGGLKGRSGQRTVFVYAGNMGVAQDMDAILQLAARMQARADVAFVFVGRGTALPSLRRQANALRLPNVEFVDEVDPSLIPALLSQCDIGIVALDPRHTTHNIPGKFLTYMQAGLPVLARINPGNDLESLIKAEGVGRAYTGRSIQEFEAVATDLLNSRPEFPAIRSRARALWSRLFSVDAATKQVVEGLKPPGSQP